jgi:hypothetical protein
MVVPHNFLFISMKLSGIILNDVGLEDRFSSWMKKYIQPLARVLLPTATAALPLDHHHSFMVQYKEVCMCMCFSNMSVCVPSPLPLLACRSTPMNFLRFSTKKGVCAIRWINQ